MAVAGVMYWKFNRRLIEWQRRRAPAWASRLKSTFGRSLEEEIWIRYLQAGGLIVVGIALMIASALALRK